MSQGDALIGTLVPWEGRGILLVDLDAFFASVEALDHPEWRGKPIIVGGDPDKRGVVSTASYEARKYGVHSAMPAAQAKRLCPDAIWTHGHYDRYAEMSDKVMDILLDESPNLQQVSIDEAFLDVTPGKHIGDNPVVIADRIRRRVAELGVTCSVGVSTSKTVSKIASDMDKPNGLTVVYPGTEESFLGPLDVGKMSGIGRKTQERLAQVGVHTLADLAQLDDENAQRIFGINADTMRLRARGIDPSPVEAVDEVKSVSNEQTYAVDLTTRDEVYAAITSISGRVGRRLRRKGLAGRTVTLKVKYADFSTHTAQRALRLATDDESVFAPVARELLDNVWVDGQPLRLIGVGLSGFDDREEQLALFDEPADEPPERKPARRQLISAADKVRDRFGSDALHYGRDLRFMKNTTSTMPQKKDDQDIKKHREK